MQPLQLQRHLEKDDLGPVYFLAGEGQHLVEEAWQRILERCVVPQARRLNGERVSAREYTFAQVRDRLSMIPMFGGKRLIAVQQIEQWGKDQQKELLAYLAKPNPRSCLVLISTERKGLEKVEAAVEAVGAAVRFQGLSEREAPRWLQERARRMGKTLPAPVALFLVEQVGPDPSLLDRELEKLAAYMGDRERIEMADAAATVSALRTHSIFEMLRYVSEGEPARALASLRSLLLGGEEPLIVLALVARHIRLVWQVRDGLERGLSQQELGKQLGLYPSAMKGYMQQAKGFSQERLYRFHRTLCATDMALKLSPVSPAILLEELVLSLCLEKRGHR